MKLWRFCVAGEDGWAVERGSSALLAPRLTKLPGLPPSLWGLTPGRDHNARQIGSLNASAPFQESDVWLCLYFGDPWIRVAAIANLCREKRVAGVAGLPSPIQYGKDFLDKLETAELGTTAELRVATLFKQAGMRVGLVAVDRERAQVEQRAAAGDVLIAAPSFDHWRDGRLANWSEDAKRIVAGVPNGVLVMSGEEITEAEAQAWGAAGYVQA